MRFFEKKLQTLLKEISGYENNITIWLDISLELVFSGLEYEEKGKKVRVFFITNIGRKTQLNFYKSYTIENLIRS